VVALALVGTLGAYLSCWAGLGFTLEPVWWASLVGPLLGGVGALLRHRGLLRGGLYLLVGVAAGVAARGGWAPALAAVALAVWSWDIGNLARARLGLGNPRNVRRLVLRAALRSTWLNLAGLGVALGFSSLRLALPFWGLVGATAGAWVAVALLLRALGRSYGWGGEASGKRSTSSGLTL